MRQIKFSIFLNYYICTKYKSKKEKIFHILVLENIKAKKKHMCRQSTPFLLIKYYLKNPFEFLNLHIIQVLRFITTTGTNNQNLNTQQNNAV
jgi:hypothetical protein